MLIGDLQPGMKFKIGDSEDARIFRVIEKDPWDLHDVRCEEVKTKARVVYWDDLWVHPVPRIPVKVTIALHMVVVFALSLLLGKVMLDIVGMWWLLSLPALYYFGRLWGKHVVPRTIRF